MNRIYFDNAATTALDSTVLEAMMPYLTEKFGNPSSIYSYGRETRLAIENARKSVAKILGAKTSEIFFTSGGTESSNTAIQSAIKDLGCTTVISSPIEHHATLHSVEQYSKQFGVHLQFVKIDALGHIDYEDLESLLAANDEKKLVSLMHANNEIGNLLDIERVGNLCETYNALFHCDTVQTVGHYPIKFNELKVHFATGAAHKFHGPKGVGLLYINEQIKITPFLQGGGQERNMRAGTENVYGIVGFAKALELATAHYEKDATYVQSLKTYFIEQLKAHVPEVCFNGDYMGKSLYTVVNAAFPKTEKSEMLLFNLDVAGICVSSGSACSSGANAGSHVIACICGNDNDTIAVRFSFSKHNTTTEIDQVIQQVKANL